MGLLEGLNTDWGNLYWDWSFLVPPGLKLQSPHVLRSSLDSARELPVFLNDLEPLILQLLPSKC